jgi:hypothetical protein
VAQRAPERGVNGGDVPIATANARFWTWTAPGLVRPTHTAEAVHATHLTRRSASGSLAVRLAGLVTPARCEVLGGLCLCLALAWAGTQAWQFYDVSLRPNARQVRELPSRQPRSVRADNPQERDRWQRVVDELGAASSAMVAGKPEWARASLQLVLKLDPGNEDALAMLQTLEAQHPS